MSVLIISQPPALTFSADLLSVKFSCTNYLQQVGVYAVNEIDFSSIPAADSVTLIKYGEYAISMVAKTASDVDDSGLTYNRTSLATVLADFRTNPILSRDFTISLNASKLKFTAKKKSLGFDFASGNVTPGKQDIQKDNYAVVFKLWLENEANDGYEMVYEATQALIPNSPGLVEVPIGDKLHIAITNSIRLGFPEYPNGNLIQCKKSCRKYYFEFAESYGQTVSVKKLYKSDTLTVLHGGLSTIAQFNKTLAGLINPNTAQNDRFLKQGNTSVYTRTNQPQYLYFYNNRAAFNGTVQVMFYDTNGDSWSSVIYNGNFESGRKYAFDVTFDKIYQTSANSPVISRYEVYIDGNTRHSETRTFYLNYQLRNYVRYFLNWSSFGSFDSRVCYGQGESEFELFSKTAQRVQRPGDDIRKGKTLTFDSKLQRSFKISTGWMSRADLLLNADFFVSNFKYRFTNGLMLPIQVTPGRIPEIADGDNLLAQQFEYKYHFDDHSYTEGDAEDSGLGIGGFFFNNLGAGSNPTGGINESDPTVPSWVKSISQADILKWNSSVSNSFYAQTAGYAYDSDKWDGQQFDDYLNQPVRTVDEVLFKSISSTVYVSGFTGFGFKVDENGNAEFDSVTIRKDLNVSVLNVREITGSGGSVAITNTAKIAQVIDAGEYYQCQIDTDGGTIAVQLRTGDIIRCQVWDGKKLKYYTARIINVQVNYFEFLKADMQGSGIPEAGDSVFQFGNVSNTARQGLIYLTNSDTGAPYMDVLDGINSENLAGKTKVRLGKLNGIVDPDFGALEGYGLYGDNVYLKNGKFKGEIIVTGGNAATTASVQSVLNVANTAINNAALVQSNLTALQNGLGGLAYQSAVELAQLGSTIISGGYIKTSLIETNALIITGGLATQTYANNAANSAGSSALSSAQGYAVTQANLAKDAAAIDATAKALAAQNAAISTASSDATNKANGALSAAQIYAQAQATQAKADAIANAASDAFAKSYAGGKMLNRDPEFALGFNGISVYNNAQSGLVQINRRSDGSTNQVPNGSGYFLEVQVYPGSKDPGLGGFYFATQSRANAIFITRFIALIPVGYSFSWHSNPPGGLIYNSDLTGNGKFKEYLFVVNSGPTGPFLSTNFFAVNGPDTRFDWYLASATVYDMTAVETDPIAYTNTKTSETINAAQSYADSVAISRANVAQANAISSASSDATAKANAARSNAVSDSQALINSIQIGAVNLLLSSKTTFTNASYNLINFASSENVLPGQEYTMTMKVVCAVQNFGLWLNAGTTFCGYFTYLGNDFYRLTFTAATTSNHINIYNIINAGGANHNATFYYAKLERGSKYTDWSPAVADVDTSIANAQTAANNAVNAYNNLTNQLKSMAYQDVVELSKLGSTVIQGGMLTNTLIDTNYVRTNIINAGYIESLEVVSKSIRTANSGQKRVEITQVTNSVIFYSAANEQLLRIDDNLAAETPGTAVTPAVYGAGIRVGQSGATATMSRYGFSVGDPNGALYPKSFIGTVAGGYRGYVKLDVEEDIILKNIKNYYGGTTPMNIRLVAFDVQDYNGNNIPIIGFEQVTGPI